MPILFLFALPFIVPLPFISLQGGNVSSVSIVVEQETEFLRVQSYCLFFRLFSRR